MAASERVVAGLSCSQVLERLSDYLDRDLPTETAARIEEHLRGCDWCERFGRRFSTVVRALRRELVDPDPVEPEVAERLRATIA